ncbi:uncharacterized protein DSM5745_01029 [Aspergillus mulundensis]|uniref:Uncharacterized protein n=1 Tax=Aspergillus mulundensis TaxID=1810919 RepID=A0A3D8T565_9EURO|nr:hypothetical protein DSM5745_01029 [Aspergillus mulundensis]RDW93707.1 hypothetical protein DSM5745_01029 [Aspergillus mulundensis]
MEDADPLPPAPAHAPPSQPTNPSPNPLNPSPVRILVQTLTHLVPSDKKIWKPERNPGSDKVISMLHRMCQHVWGCAFDPERYHRWYTYGEEHLGYNSRACFFLIDTGTAEDDEQVPVLAFEWTGAEFKPRPDILQSSDVVEELKHTPFTPRPRSPGRKERPVKKRVRDMLRAAERVPDAQLEYIQQHPEDMEWLKQKLRPRFYANLLAQIEARPGEREEDERDAERLSAEEPGVYPVYRGHDSENPMNYIEHPFNENHRVQPNPLRPTPTKPILPLKRAHPPTLPTSPIVLPTPKSPRTSAPLAAHKLIRLPSPAALDAVRVRPFLAAPADGLGAAGAAAAAAVAGCGVGAGGALAEEGHGVYL